MTSPLYLGIDGGQTSTKAALADAYGHLLGTGSGSPCDHIQGPQGPARNRAAIHSAIASVLDATGVDPNAIVAVGMGLTSAPRELQAEPIFEGLLREVVNPQHVWIDHDVASNLAGASAGQPGVVVIAGGGSIAYGVSADGKEGKAGGMGYLMGDEGSGWWIGLQALQAAGAAADGRAPSTALLPAVLEHYGIPTIRHIVSILYGPEFTRDQVSGFARTVTALADSDRTARGIVRKAGWQLAGLALAAIGQMQEPGTPVDIYPTGGVFAAGPHLMDPFTQRITDSWPEASIRAPQFDPVFGALFRAYQAAGIALTPELLANLRG